MSQFQNTPFLPIAALGTTFNPRHTLGMRAEDPDIIGAVEIIPRLELDQTGTF